MSDLRIDPSSTWAWQALTGSVSARLPRLTSSTASASDTAETPAADDVDAAGPDESTATFLIFSAMPDLATSPSLLKRAVDAYASSRDDAGASSPEVLRAQVSSAEAATWLPLLSLLMRT